jgi:hypothetical protein
MIYDFLQLERSGRLTVQRLASLNGGVCSEAAPGPHAAGD